MRVKLTQAELELASLVGARRHIEALSRGLPDRHGYNGRDGWTIHIEGAAGEIAVAKALGRFWGGSVNTFKNGGDVSGLEVRTRKHEKWIRTYGDRPPAYFVPRAYLTPLKEAA